MTKASEPQQLSLKTKLLTSRVAETRAFYERVFNMVLVEEWDHPDDAGVILSFAADRHEVLLEIYRDEKPHSYSGVSLQFKVADLDRFVDSLPPELVYEGPKPRPWGSVYVYIDDPNGVNIVVYEGGW